VAQHRRNWIIRQPSRSSYQPAPKFVAVVPAITNVAHQRRAAAIKRARRRSDAEPMLPLASLNLQRFVRRNRAGIEILGILPLEASPICKSLFANRPWSIPAGASSPASHFGPLARLSILPYSAQLCIVSQDQEADRAQRLVSGRTDMNNGDVSVAPSPVRTGPRNRFWRTAIHQGRSRRNGDSAAGKKIVNASGQRILRAAPVVAQIGQQRFVRLWSRLK